jgi:hypothetical protein
MRHPRSPAASHDHALVLLRLFVVGSGFSSLTSSSTVTATLKFDKTQFLLPNDGDALVPSSDTLMRLTIRRRHATNLPPTATPVHSHHPKGHPFDPDSPVDDTLTISADGTSTDVLVDLVQTDPCTAV